MQFKLLMGAAMAAVLLCLAPTTQITAAAEPYSIVLPLYDIGYGACFYLCISGSTASCESRVTGDSAETITAEQYLQKQGILWIWSTYDDAEWTETVEAGECTIPSTGATIGYARAIMGNSPEIRAQSLTYYVNSRECCRTLRHSHRNNQQGENL